MRDSEKIRADIWQFSSELDRRIARNDALLARLRELLGEIEQLERRVQQQVWEYRRRAG